MAGTLHTLSIISFVLAVAFLILAIVLWFVFKILNVIGDLSGSNARKSIERMRQQNEKSGDKSYKSSKKNLIRGKLTETMKDMKDFSGTEETGLLKENSAKLYEEENTGLLEEATALLNDSGETESLEEAGSVMKRPESGVAIRIFEEVMIIHTDEIIS